MKDGVSTEVVNRRTAESEAPAMLAVIADHRVVRFEVAMDQARAMDRGEALGSLAVRAGDLGGRATVGPRVRSQRFAADKLHDDHDLIVVNTDVMDRDDVWMSDASKRLRLCEGLGPTQIRAHAHELDCNFALELGVSRAVDNAHATCAEAGIELEAADRWQLDVGAREQLV